MVLPGRFQGDSSGIPPAALRKTGGYMYPPPCPPGDDGILPGNPRNLPESPWSVLGRPRGCPGKALGKPRGVLGMLRGAPGAGGFPGCSMGFPWGFPGGKSGEIFEISGKTLVERGFDPPGTPVSPVFSRCTPVEPSLFHPSTGGAGKRGRPGVGASGGMWGAGRGAGAGAGYPPCVPGGTSEGASGGFLGASGGFLGLPGVGIPFTVPPGGRQGSPGRSQAGYTDSGLI